MEEKRKLKLRSPAGNLNSLKGAMDSGADGVYIGFQSATNLRNFPGLNFSQKDAASGVEYVHRNGREVYITINTYPQDVPSPNPLRPTPRVGTGYPCPGMGLERDWVRGSELKDCFEAVDMAYSIGTDAIIATDIAVMDYARKRYPDLRIHLSVQAGASNYRAINFYKKEFGISCVILPRVLNLDEIKEIRENTDIELEAFVFGSLCANYEGRCFLSSYITGQSCNSKGACSPAEFVEFSDDNEGNLIFKLNGIVLNRYSPDEICSYPTLCKSRLRNPLTGQLYYAFQNPVSLNVLSRLPQLVNCGVDAIKIEGRQRSSAYVEGVTRIFRRAVDELYENRFVDHSQELLPYIEGEAFCENLVGSSSS